MYRRHSRAIGNIEADTSGLDFDQFAADRRVRQLVERNVEIISEASRRLPEDAKAAEPDVPWREIAGIGNIFRHDYGIVRPDILWGYTVGSPDWPETGYDAAACGISGITLMTPNAQPA